MNRCGHIGLTVLLLLLALRSWAGGDEVVVVYNTQMPGSEEVADHYAIMRQVPAGQVFGLALSTNEEISRVEYEKTLQTPLLDRLTSSGLWTFGPYKGPATHGHAGTVVEGVVQSKIRYAVLCYGVPLKISEDPWLFETPPAYLPKEFQVNHAAVDSELAALPLIRMDLPLSGPIPNPFRNCTNELALTPTNGILLVARLDGPSASIARSLVDKAMFAETNGLWGRAYIDARGLPTNSSYYPGDVWMLSAANTAYRLGFETNLDDAADTFPASYPLCQVALYAGWYDANASGPFTAPTVDFMPGAFAYHLYSYSANNLRTLKDHWCGPLIGKGATCTMGCVYEPYLMLTPNIAFFMEAWGNGFTFGEAAWVAQAGLSWQTTVIGDPLYRPFGRSVLEQHNALVKRNSPLADWATLRLIDLDLSHGARLLNVGNLLTHLKETPHSAILTEKLADVCTDLGRPAASIRFNQFALGLATNPGQRLRLRLKLADQLQKAGRPAEVADDLRQLLVEQPGYPGRPEIEHRLKNLPAK